ncbi:hypothetical protein FQA39_LY07391 [Lamprigera yunnana]|nr:hypothetical protein FQA39_LY07391 [Lamprigera yunnana]
MPPPKPPRRNTSRLSKSNTEASSDSHLTDFKEYTESVPSSSRLDSSGSHREKFKERFEHLKKQASKSLSKANNFQSKTNKIRSLMRSVHMVKAENDLIDAELRFYETSKVSQSMVSSVEVHNFLCAEDSAEEFGDNVLNKSTDVLIPIVDEEEVKFCSPINLHFIRKTSENELFWKPSITPLEVTEKIETEEPRFLADEGFYIKKKPKLPFWHLNISERRLLGLNNKIWFDYEGQLDMYERPDSSNCYKPNFYNSHCQLKTKYVKASLDHNLSTTNCNKEQNILDISIISIKFKHHPLFSIEQVLEQKLITQYHIYNKIIRENKLERMSKQLNALRKAKASVGKESTIYYDEVKKMRELYFEEAKNFRTLLKLILQTWRYIKKIRQSNQCSNTTTQLIITKTLTDYSSEREIWNKEIEITTAEMFEELELENEVKQSKKEKAENVSKPLEIIKQEVIEIFLESFKPPGEPVVNFEINYNNTITVKVENTKEKMRRNVINTTKIYLKIICNKMEVCKSKPINLCDKFFCSVDEYFSIQLTKIPEFFEIEIYEQPNTLPKRKLAEIKIKIPNKSVINLKQSLKLDFKKEEIIHYKHEGVGSGVDLQQLSDYSNKEDILYTSGTLNCEIGWDPNNFVANIGNTVSDMDISTNILNEEGIIDVNKLLEWINRTKPDPEDPKHSSLYEYIQNFKEDENEIESPNNLFFRKNLDTTPLEFCEIKDLQEDLRLQLLSLRNQNEPEFVGMVIPNRIKEIPENILYEYKRRIEEDNQGIIQEIDEQYDEINEKRFNGEKHLKQVYTKVFQQCRNTLNNLVYEDVVNEKIIPHIESLTKNIISNIMSWIQIQPSKHILPPLAQKKSTIKIGDLNAPLKVKINVKFAFNVPLRSGEKSVNSTVCPFVVATYENTSLQTSIGNGSNPVWNEELILRMNSSNTDYLSPNSMNGCIVIKLFDEVICKVRQEQIKARNWLGSIEIPISAVANSYKMEGLFKLRKPSALLGYVHDFNHLSYQEDTSLWLKISLEPNIPKLTQNMKELETTELPYIRQHILNWNEVFNNNYPQRKFSALVIDINGKTVCVSRYIKALEPPQLNKDKFVVTTEQCTQYISMIPFTDCNKFYQNVWLTAVQLLKFMIGSVIDHAIALVCYLTSLDVETWLLLGYELAHGSTAYALIREYSRDLEPPLHYIYDVTTAKKYNVLDVSCPLQKVFCVINEHNVWANIQRSDQLDATRFDFTVNADWLPLFNHEITTPTCSIQQKLNYISTPDIHELEIKIEKKIRQKIAKIRTHERTTWNYSISKALKKEIIKFERSFAVGKKNMNVSSDIFNIISTHYVNGYILNLAYTNVSMIVSKIISTGIHSFQGLNTEFGLAVQVCPYPNHVLSVWISLVVLNPID